MDTPAGDNRPPVYYDVLDGSRVLIIRASAVGTSCTWELVAAGQGVEPGPLPASLVEAFRMGTELEPVIVGMLEGDYKITFDSHQEEEELWLSDDVAIRYHPDGIGNIPASAWALIRANVSMASDIIIPPYQGLSKVVVEIKAFGPDLWNIAKRKGFGETIAEYPWQLSAMMIHAGLPGLWVGLNKETRELVFQLVRQPPVSLTELQLKASLIKLGVEGEDILTSDRPCDDPTHWPCRYLHIRPEPEPDSKRSADKTWIVSDDRRAEVDQLVRDYVYHKGQADEAIARRDEAKQRIIELADEHDKAKKVVTEKWQVPVARGHASYLAVDEMSDEDRELYQALKNKYTRQKDKAPYITKIKRIGE